MKIINTTNYHLGTKANFSFKGFIDWQTAWKRKADGQMTTPMKFNKKKIKEIIEKRLNTKVRHSFSSDYSLYFYAKQKLIRVSNHGSNRKDCRRIKSCWWELKNEPAVDQEALLQNEQLFGAHHERTAFQIGVVPFAKMKVW